MAPITQRLLVLLGLIAVIELGVIAYYQVLAFNRPPPEVKVELPAMPTTPAAPMAENVITMPDAETPAKTAETKPDDANPNDAMPSVVIPGGGLIPGIGGGGEMTDQVRAAVAKTMSDTLYQKCMKTSGEAGPCDCVRNTVLKEENLVVFDMATRQATVDKEAWSRVQQVVRDRCGLAMK